MPTCGTANVALALALVLLSAASLSETAYAQAGFPCAAYEYVDATWHPPQEAATAARPCTSTTTATRS